MYKRHEIGKIGEKLATKYLEQNKYRIIKQNFRCKQGEIDIIAIDEQCKEQQIVFIEVKTRTSLEFGTPAEAVNKIKKQHIARTAKFFLYLNNIKGADIRFDTIEVLLSNNKYKINHIKQIM